jgi:hypothetical protein
MLFGTTDGQMKLLYTVRVRVPFFLLRVPYVIFHRPTRISALPVGHHILPPGLELTLELQPAFDHLR